MRLTLMLVLTLAAVAVACGDTTGDAATEYEVAVSFIRSRNTSYVEDDIDQVADFLRGFDADLEFVIQESFPPTAVARLRTDTSAFCPTVEDEIEARTYVASVSCAVADDNPPTGDPNEPVAATPDGTS